MKHKNDYLMELESAKTIISRIVGSIEESKDWSLSNSNKMRLNEFVRFLKLLSIELSTSKDEINLSLLNYINSFIVPLEIDIDLFLKNSKTDSSLKTLLTHFDLAKKSYKGSMNNDIDDDERKAINSESYYNQRIEELKSQTTKLTDELKKAQGDEARNQDEINKLNFEFEEAKRKISDFEVKLEIKKQQEDAKEDWKNKINSTFEELKAYLKPIKIEQNRLNVLFWVYLVMSALLVIAVVVIEWIAVCKFISVVGFPDFKQYITIYLPLPVAGALLWGFIFQMNRAQRQLVVVAKSIHKVEYVQGLLLSINKLAPTIEDGRSRINIAIDKLISNHLGLKEIETEDDLIIEENRDKKMSVDTLLKLLKAIKV